MTGGIVGALAAYYVILLRKLVRERNRAARAPFAMARPEASAANPTTAFESTDWELGPVAVVYVAVLVLLAISCLAIVLAYPNSLPDVSRGLSINPPGPRLQTDAEGDLARFRTEENQRLNSYYWIDKQKGTVHVPIEQAMRKLVQTGIPGFPKAQP
jgi:hypothetical protein